MTLFIPKGGPLVLSGILTPFMTAVSVFLFSANAFWSFFPANPEEVFPGFKTEAFGGLNFWAKLPIKVIFSFSGKKTTRTAAGINPLLQEAGLHGNVVGIAKKINGRIVSGGRSNLGIPLLAVVELSSGHVIRRERKSRCLSSQITRTYPRRRLFD